MNEREQIQKAVKSEFERNIQNALAESGKTDNEGAGEGDDTGAGEGDKNVDESTITESWEVTAMKNGYRGNPSDMVEFKVNSQSELTKAARSGKYEFFTVVKSNGDEVEYSVENGKLVEM